MDLDMDDKHYSVDSSDDINIDEEEEEHSERSQSECLYFCIFLHIFCVFLFF